MAENKKIPKEINENIDDTHKDQETHEENLESKTQEDENSAPVVLSPSMKKALLAFRCRLEDAIHGNYLFGKKSHARGNGRERENLKEISLWGVPLLPSKNHEGTDVILLKFLKARDFKASEAFEMLRKMLKWRRENKIEGILDEEFGSDFEQVVYLKGEDKQGHPLCFNIYGAFKDKKLYKKTFGTQEKRAEFLRWRVQFMEKGIKELSFKAGGVNSIVHIIDFKNSPGPVMKELRWVTKKAVMLLQDNYPELIHRNIMINVPFWYYAFHALLSRFMTQRTKSKFVFARPSKVTKTLLKLIAPENIPVQYGGLQRENDSDFSPAEKASELIVRGGTAHKIKIPVAEAGVTVVWDVNVVGWEVTYKEEFIPDDECSYKILLQNDRKIGDSVRNSFHISEPGKIVISIENESFKKRRVLYRFKAKPTVPMYVFHK
ncbi:hypothetical protein L1049_005002 [Liquidambar formosana]|uniref:CRAL-TRIO domain-containing protein n=1 Tax=Liquidambar formosana TaxID=63359 RepID=A0AAP0RQ62_LIQFO